MKTKIFHFPVLASASLALSAFVAGAGEFDFRDACLAKAKVLVEGKAPKAELLKNANELSKAMPPTYGVWCAWFYQRYVEPEKWTDEQLDFVEKGFWIGAKLWAEEGTDKSFAPWLLLGDAHLFKEQYAEALAAYEKAIAKDPKGRDLAKCLYGRANALLGLGRRKEAYEALKDYQARKLPPFGGRGVEPINWYVSCAVQDLEGRDLDDLKMPRYTGAKAYPEPQISTYSDKFVAVDGYDLEVSGLEPGDRRLELLDVKFTRFGAPKKAGAAFKVKVTVDPRTRAFAGYYNHATYAAFRAKKHADLVREKGDLPDKSPETFRPYMENEAYTLDVTEQGATIVAKTKQGALWGIVSLVQLWDQAAKKIRVAQIVDWPDVEKRGYLGNYWPGTLEFTLFNKLNSVCQQQHPCDSNTFRPVNWYLEEFMGKEFHDFGLELFFGNVWMTQAPQLPMCSPRTLPFRTAVCRRYAKAHIGVYYPLDDIRFPICPQDRKAYGDFIGKIDGAHQNAIFQGVVKDYPDWRFIVCPPPYMGPDGRYNNAESRDHYLEAWSKELDPRIEGYWTGARVKSYTFTETHNAWVLKEYGRRPYLFQNGMAFHNLEHYAIDEINWPEFYCPGTVDKVLAGYHLNASLPQCTPRISTAAAFVWNIGRYNPTQATKIGLAQVSGEKTYDLLIPCLEDLTYFDKYRYGETDERIDLENGPELERRALNIETCWSNATAYTASIGAPIYGSIGRGVGWMRDVMRRFRNPPDAARAYAGHLEAIRKEALAATTFDEKRGHTYVSPVAMSGGVNEIAKRAPRGSRDWRRENGTLFKALKRNGTGHSSCSMRFTCETFPPGADYKIELAATSVGGPAQLRFLINGEKFFEGDPGTGTDPFKPVLKTVVIPEAKLKRNNLVTIENLRPGKDAEALDGSYRIRYAVIRTTEKGR